MCFYDTEVFQTLLKKEVAESKVSWIKEYLCDKNTEGMERFQNSQVVLVSAFKDQAREKPQVFGRH